MHWSLATGEGHWSHWRRSKSRPRFSEAGAGSTWFLPTCCSMEDPIFWQFEWELYTVYNMKFNMNVWQTMTCWGIQYPLWSSSLLWGERVWASWSASWASLLGLAVGELEDFPATFYGLNLWRIEVRKRQKSRAVEMAKLQCREKRCRWSSLNTRRNSFLSEPFSKSSALHSQNCDESFLVWQIRCVHDVFVLLCDCHKTHQRCEQVSPDILQKSFIAFVPKPTPKKGHSWHAGTNLVVGALSLAKSNSSFWRVAVGHGQKESTQAQLDH